jgi:ubiquinone/menaquinone biosynthesis C-methylase UbiE
MLDYDLELQRQNRALRLAYGIARSDHVLDIGCGTGQTTCDAARLASCGAVLGIDRSKEMIDRARERTRAEGIENVTYECADAEQYSFCDGCFNVAISRFGTMFFADPVIAFSKIGRALHRNGRFVMMVWQKLERNEWAVLIRQALEGEIPLRQHRAADSQPFSLGDPAPVRRVLKDAGFADVTFDEVHEPVYYGSDSDAALEFVSQFSLVQETIASLPETTRERSIGRLCDLMATHLRHDGVWFDARAWIVAARRA